jgi:AcrR family transcriptional regulator
MTTTARRSAARGTMSREQIVRAAVRTVRAGQFEQMTIRSLAADLNVSPMSLYRHVRDKDDLLNEVVDRLLVRRWRPRSDSSDWYAWTKEAAERFRDFLITQPVALYVYLRHPVVSPVSIARMETMIAVLRSAGFDDDAARRAYATVHTYTIGFAALESSRARSTRAVDLAHEVAAELAAFTTPRQFSEGLTYLLEGIERQRFATNTAR